MIAISAIIFKSVPLFINTPIEKFAVLIIGIVFVAILSFIATALFEGFSGILGFGFGYKRIGNTDFFYKIIKDRVVIRINDYMFAEYEYKGSNYWDSILDDEDEGDKPKKIKPYTKLPRLFITPETTTLDINNYLNDFITLDKCVKDKIQMEKDIVNKNNKQSKFLKEELKNFKI